MPNPKSKKQIQGKKGYTYLVTASHACNKKPVLHVHFEIGTTTEKEISTLVNIQLAIIKEIEKRIKLFNAHKDCEHKKD